MFLLAEKIVNEVAIEGALYDACKILGEEPGSQVKSVFEHLTARMEVLAQKNPLDYRRLMSVVSRLESLRAVLRRDEMLALLSRHYGLQTVTMSGAPVLHVSGSRVSVTKSGTDVAWHQDWPNTGGSLNSVVVWVPLGGVTEASGGLFLAEGHSFTLLDYEIVPPVCRIKPHISERFNQVYLAPCVGNAIVFDQFHPHRSAASDATRLAVSFRFEDAACAHWRDRGYEYLHQKQLKQREFTDWAL